MPRVLSGFARRLFRLSLVAVLGIVALTDCSIVSEPEVFVTPTVEPTALPPITQGAIPFVETPECAVTAVSSSSSSSSAPVASPALTATAESAAAREALVRRQREAVGRISTEARSFLDTQDWTSTPDANAVAVLDAIDKAEDCRDSMAKYRPTADYIRAIDILRAASGQPWYRDGLSTEELATVADLFEAYVELSRIHLGSTAVVAEPGALIVQAIERGVAGGVVLPRSGRRSLFVLTSGEGQAREVFRQATETLPAIERFAGVLNPSGVVFLILDVESLCGQTPANVSTGSMQLVFIGTKCLAPIAVYHELTHAFLGADYPGWYTEGMADFLASYLTSSINNTYAQYIGRLIDTFTTINLNQRFAGLVDPAQYAAGFVFLKEAYDILGYENMAVLARGLRPSASGAQIVAEIRRLTPLERRDAMESVIALRVGK